MSTFDLRKGDLFGDEAFPMERAPVHDRLTVPPLSEQQDDDEPCYGACDGCHDFRERPVWRVGTHWYCERCREEVEAMGWD